MKHIKIIIEKPLKKGKDTGCRECQTGCQSACKTSCTVGNQACVKKPKSTSAKIIQSNL